MGQAALIAVDTNVILRFLTHTPDAQFKSAKALFERGDLFISSPVVFEVFFTLTGMVLAFSDEDALNALEALFSLPGVSVQELAAFEAAISHARHGLPFKDACVLAFSRQADELVTFDRQFSRRAAKLGLRPPVAPTRRWLTT